MKISLLLSAFAVLLLMGCFGANGRLSYSVAFVNDGKETISVDDVVLNAHDRPAVAGDLSSGQKMTDLSPSYLPDAAVKIVWIVKQTGERIQTNMVINPPKDFITGRNPTIILHIYPETKKVKVTYEIEDRSTGNVRTVE